MSAAMDRCLLPEVVYARAVEKRLPELNAMVFDVQGKALIAEIQFALLRLCAKCAELEEDNNWLRQSQVTSNQ
ncbi:MAG: hypothetical protein QOE26_874 [Verrucomicrobiota bacterium]|jgi:hypothetical protein